MAEDPRQLHYEHRFHLRYAIKHKVREYNHRMELPLAAILPLLKRINMTLYAPHWFDFGEGVLGRDLDKYERIWEAEDIEWLYPIREMKSLGFTRFEHLSVKIVYLDYANAEMETDFQAWVKEEINGIADAKELDILFCRASNE